VTYRAAGYLGSDITDSLPSASVSAAYWEPLKLQLFSWIKPRIDGKTGAVTFPGLARARALNAYYQVKIYHDPGDMSLGIESPWGQEVRRIAQAALATNYSKIQLDILNEPDYSGYWPGNINDPRILDAWRIAHDAARSVSPDLDPVGLNFAFSYNWLKTTFLPTMKAENRLPDIVSWHEINSPMSQIDSRIQDMRSVLSHDNMDVEDVSINEYNYNDSHLQPGYGIQFISELESGRVQSASRACWEEVAGGSYDCAPHINGFLTTGGQPRSIWHTYKAYADMTGTLSRSRPLKLPWVSPPKTTRTPGVICCWATLLLPALSVSSSPIYRVHPSTTPAFPSQSPSIASPTPARPAWPRRNCCSNSRKRLKTASRGSPSLGCPCLTPIASFSRVERATHPLLLPFGKVSLAGACTVPKARFLG
jgi:hypothetical protein